MQNFSKGVNLIDFQQYIWLFLLVCQLHNIHYSIHEHTIRYFWQADFNCICQSTAHLQQVLFRIKMTIKTLWIIPNCRYNISRHTCGNRTAFCVLQRHHRHCRCALPCPTCKAEIFVTFYNPHTYQFCPTAGVPGQRYGGYTGIESASWLSAAKNPAIPLLPQKL